MDYHTEYAAINSRVHRKPALVAGSPALVRHIAFWKPLNTSRKAWMLAADSYIIAVYRAIKAIHYKPIFDPIDPKKKYKGTYDSLFVLNDTKDDNEITAVTGAIDGAGPNEAKRRLFYLFDHIYIDEHAHRADYSGESAITQENFRPIFPPGATEVDAVIFDATRDLRTDQVPQRFKTVTFKFSFWGATSWVKFELHQEYITISIILDFAAVPRNFPPDVLLAQEPIDMIQQVIDTINSETKERYSAIFNRELESIGLRREQMLKSHQKIYNDFWRDHINPTLLETEGAQPFLKGIGTVFYDTRGLILRMNMKPNLEVSSAEENATIVTGLFPAAHSSAALDTIQPDPFFTEYDGFDINMCDAFWPFITALDKGKNDRVEYAASKLLNARALHITSLGNIPAATLNVKVPVKFLLVTSLRNRWQIGRLIDRLFVLETSRVAALMNVEKISASNEKLNQQFIKLRNFQETRSGSGQAIQNELAEFSKDLAKLSNESGCDGGLEYRIERSRYYVAQFKEMMDTFRIKRIEGYQTFTEFTQRRFFTIYRSIERLGFRLVQFRQQLDDLNDQIQAEQMLELSRVNNQRQKMTVDLHIRLIELQIAAEMTLIVPLSYYAFHLLAELLEPLLHIPPWAIVGLCLCAFGIFFWRRKAHHQEKLEQLKMESEAIKRHLGEA